MSYNLLKIKKGIVFAIVSMFVLFISCSKNYPSKNPPSIVGDWVFIGGYQNSQVFSTPLTSNSVKEIYFNQDSTYVINSQTEDSMEYGLYSVGHGQETVSSGSIKSSDSIEYNFRGPIKANEYRLAQYSRFYQIKIHSAPQSDTLFLFDKPSSLPTVQKFVEVYIRNN